MEEKTFVIQGKAVLTDPGMYGWDQILIKKHAWPEDNTVMRGAILHDAETDHNYFVTEADLARYLDES
ncbi:MAG: hypothetical protein GEU97_19550 [Actinophytocola sp.]|nr:hypothetical protein [Actinophytocola sp.]